MRDVSVAYISGETGIKRQPAETYHIWTETGDDWFFTNGDVAIDLSGETWQPATITRGSVEYDSNLDASKLNIVATPIMETVSDYIGQNPLSTVWVQVNRLFRNQSPLEAGVIFVGQVDSIGLQGVEASLNCVGFESFLKAPAPRFRYQQQCNHEVFDENCGLISGEFSLVTTVSAVSTNGLIVTCAGVSGELDYYKQGFLEWNNNKRMIAASSGEAMTLVYKIPGMTASGEVTLFPGCDGQGVTCRDKFDNIPNLLGFEDIPLDNPATWL